MLGELLRRHKLHFAHLPLLYSVESGAGDMLELAAQPLLVHLGVDLRLAGNLLQRIPKPLDLVCCFGCDGCRIRPVAPMLDGSQPLYDVAHGRVLF